MPITSLKTYIGESFPPLSLVVQGDHFPPTISPPLPFGLSFQPFERDRHYYIEGSQMDEPGYQLSGRFQTAGLFSFVITISNLCGSASKTVFFNVSGKRADCALSQILLSPTALSSSAIPSSTLALTGILCIFKISLFLTAVSMSARTPLCSSTLPQTVSTPSPSVGHACSCLLVA